MKKLLVAAAMAASCASQTSSLNAVMGQDLNLANSQQDARHLVADGYTTVLKGFLGGYWLRVDMQEDVLEAYKRSVSALEQQTYIAKQAYMAKLVAGGLLATAAVVVACKKAYDYYQAKRNAQQSLP